MTVDVLTTATEATSDFEPTLRRLDLQVASLRDPDLHRIWQSLRPEFAAYGAGPRPPEKRRPMSYTEIRDFLKLVFALRADDKARKRRLAAEMKATRASMHKHKTAETEIEVGRKNRGV